MTGRLHHHELQQTTMSDRAAGRRWATTNEVAEHLKVHPNTVTRWADEGRIRRHRFGPRLVRYDLNEIDATTTRSI